MIGLAGGIAATSIIAAAIQGIYGVASSFNTFLDEHIELMKKSDNTTISRTGRVIEAAKYGFGIGYVVPVVVIAIGQLILGNTFAAVATVGSAAMLSNPIAMTCAAVGAVYYGWSALSEIERNEIVDRLCKDMEIGIELVKSIVSFVLSKMKELFSQENIKEIKRYVGEAAASFGKTLGDVTGTIKDRVVGAYAVVKETSKDVSGSIKTHVGDAYTAVKETSDDAVEYVAGKIKRDKMKP